MYSNLIEDISDGSVDHDYDLIGTGDNKSTRRDIAETYDKPKRLFISHQDNGSGENAQRRTLIKLTNTVADASGNTGVLSCSLQLTIPKGQAIAADAAKLVTELKSFLTKAGYIDKLVAGEI